MNLQDQARANLKERGIPNPDPLQVVTEMQKLAKQHKSPPPDDFGTLFRGFLDKHKH